ncbi:MAG: hypothetical protein NC483_03500 [Ruminococcus sp.]|nr:hypothetical protein [Ruminococcus sp.]
MRLDKLKNNKKVIYGVIIGLLLILSVTMLVSRAKYRVTATYELASGTVKNNSNYDRVAIYTSNGDGVNYTELDKTSSMPSEGYTINEEKSYCYIRTKDKIDKEAKLYTNEYGEHVISNLQKESKCILYFDKGICGSACKSILANIDNKNIRNKEYLPFNKTVTGENALTEKIIYYAEDDDGKTYYYAGNPTDNWVLFGDYYWRIIRINGNGSIRMIYQGTEPKATGEGTQIGISNFSDISDDNTYTGYMYGTPGSSTYKETHENKNDSNVKKELDKWFINSNIKQGSIYFDKIDSNTGFCGDRTPSLKSSEIDKNGGTGTITTYYGAYIRGVTKKLDPTFKCANDNDLYTVDSANKGNGALTYPVGLITVDEVNYAGLAYGISAKNNYLYTSLDYWTMSPSNFTENGKTSMFRVTGDYFGNVWGLYKYGIRPVINIRSDIKLTGLGTIDNPYKVF